MRVVVRKRSILEVLTLFIVVYPFLIAFLIQFCGLPSTMKYVLDIAWCLVTVLSILQPRMYIRRKALPFFLIVGLFLLYTLIFYLINYQSAIFYLWGFRNNFRYYAAFFAFALYLTERDTGYLLRFVDILFWVNVPISFVQFFVLGYSQDYLGGIFGVERGCNGYSMIFFCIVIGKSLLSYMNGEESTIKCFTKCGLSLIISAMAELKMYFIVFVIILIMAAMLTKFSIRKFWIIFAASIMIMVGSSLLVIIFGSSNQLSFSRIIELITASNYSSAEDLGRFTAIPTIARRFLTSLPDRLFGMGLGNCETSSFSICNTPFFQTYSYLHYTWFSSACLFLETGITGLVFYLSFFVLSFCSSYNQMKQGQGNLLYCQMAMIIAVLCIILTFYNASLRADVGYVAFFALALPHVRKERIT